MPPASGVVIENLSAFRTALRRAEQATPRELSAALRRVGIPIVAGIRTIVPTGPARDPHPGLLRGSYRVSVRGTIGSVVSKAPYAAGAEWGQHGKWAGFARYGEPGRFAWKTVEEESDLIVEEVFRGLTDVAQIYGWALP
jgi:hypothetical protein